MKTKLFLGSMLAAIIFSANIFAAPKPKITMEKAQEIALKKVKGDVEQADTVTYHRKPLYSIFIKRSNGVTTHVLVTENGKVKSMRDETPAKAKIK